MTPMMKNTMLRTIHSGNPWYREISSLAKNLFI